MNDELVVQNSQVALLGAASQVGAERAKIETASKIAHMFPRDDEEVIEVLAHFLTKPRSADASLYRLERKDRSTGETKVIQNFTVRFSEKVVLTMGNIMMRQEVLTDTPDSMTIVVTLYDAQRNIELSEPVFVSKTVERSKLWAGQTSVSERKNARGQTVFVVKATDDELRTKMQAMISKARRNLILQLLPGEYKDELLEIALETKKKDAETQAGSEEGRKKIVGVFSSIGVTKEAIEKHLGHKIETLTADELVALRGIYRAMTGEGLTWEAATGSDQPEAPTKTTLDLSQVTPGKTEDHTPVDAPLSTDGKCIQIWSSYIESNELNEEQIQALEKKFTAYWGLGSVTELKEFNAEQLSDWLVTADLKARKKK